MKKTYETRVSHRARPWEMQPHQEESLDCEQATIWEEASSLPLFFNANAGKEFTFRVKGELLEIRRKRQRILIVP